MKRRAQEPTTVGAGLARPRLLSGALLLATLGLWQLLALGERPDFVLPPTEVAAHAAAAVASGELFPHVAASLARSLPGWVLGSLVGVVLGLIAGVARGFDETVSPAVFLTYPVPKIVFLPLFMLWFGIGDVSKVLVIALACFYPCFINAYYGARSTPRIVVWSALNMGAGPLAVFRKVVVPSALPLVLAGLRVSLALSFILLFSTEMINARSGLGFLIRQSEANLRFDLMYVSIVAVAALGYASDQVLLFARRRLLRWQEVGPV